MVLNGNHKGEKCLIKENHCLSSDENTADFWKKYEADLAECQETKVVHMGDVDFFVEIYVKNPQLIILEADMFRSLLQKSEKCWDFM